MEGTQRLDDTKKGLVNGQLRVKHLNGLEEGWRAASKLLLQVSLKLTCPFRSFPWASLPCPSQRDGQLPGSAVPSPLTGGMSLRRAAHGPSLSFRDCSQATGLDTCLYYLIS